MEYNDESNLKEFIGNYKNKNQFIDEKTIKDYNSNMQRCKRNS